MRTSSGSVCRTYFLALAVLVATTLMRAQVSVWVAGADMVANELGANPTSNPNSLVTAWSYGYRSALLDTSLILYNAGDHGVDRGVAGLNGYSKSGGAGPDVMVNTTNATLVTNYGFGPNSGIAPSELRLHPASDGTFAVVRWMAPAAGSYTVSAYWRDDDPHGGNGSDVHIVLNGVSLFSNSFPNGGQVSLGTPLTVTLSAGDRIDFLLGAAGDWGFDSTAFNATISALAIPEPETLGLLLVGGGLALVARRRRA